MHDYHWERSIIKRHTKKEKLNIRQIKGPQTNKTKNIHVKEKLHVSKKKKLPVGRLPLMY